MEAKDLRPGNIILDLYGTPTKVRKVEEGNFSEGIMFFTEDQEKPVHSDKPVWHCQINDNPEFHYRPMPITEEILLKAGFALAIGSKTLYDLSMDIEGRYIDITLSVLDGHFALVIDKQRSFSFPTKLKYAHQLQNLYFALTEKELSL